MAALIPVDGLVGWDEWERLCDECGRWSANWTADDVPCPQEGGALEWVTCNDCGEDALVAALSARK